MTRLFAFDLDGTILQDDHIHISEETIAAFKKASERGVHLVPASGRLPKIMPQQLLDLPFIQYGICANGALVYDFKKHSILHLDIIPYKAAAAIIHVLEEHPPLPLHIFAGEDSYMDNQGMAILEKSKATQRVTVFLRDKQIVVESLYQSVLKKEIEISKITLPPMEDELRNSLIEQLGKIPGLSLTSSMPGNLEINSDKVSKATGLHMLCRLLDIPIEETIAIGDSSNDREILKEAGIGVAMGNGTEEIKSLADFITKTNMQNGVAHAIEHFILNNS